MKRKTITTLILTLKRQLEILTLKRQLEVICYNLKYADTNFVILNCLKYANAAGEHSIINTKV